MVAVGAQRFSSAVRDGRLLLVCADVSALPLSGATFDCAYALHSHMYWPSLIGGISEIHRVLSPGGRLLLAMDTVAGIPLLQRLRSGYRPSGPDQLTDVLTRVGFNNITAQKLARGVVTVTGDRA